MCFIARMGTYLSGYTWEPIASEIANAYDLDDYDERDMGRVESFYLNNKTLAVISGAGLIIGGVGVLALLASMGYLPGLVTFIHAGSIVPYHVMIFGASVSAVGGSITLVHGSMLGSKIFSNKTVD